MRRGKSVVSSSKSVTVEYSVVYTRSVYTIASM